MEFRTFWNSNPQPLFKATYLPRISNSLAQHLVVLSRNSALTVVTIRHVANRAFYDTDISIAVGLCESMLYRPDALAKLQIAKKAELEADVAGPHFDVLCGVFFEWLYDRLPVLLLLNRPDGRNPNEHEVEYISRDCFLAGQKAFASFANNELQFPGGYGTMMNLAKQRRPDKTKLSDAIYDSTWLDSIFKRHFPDLLSNSNQSFFAGEVLKRCFPMFYNDLLHYYRQMTIDASNFGWCQGQSIDAELFAADSNQNSNNTDSAPE